MMSDDVWKWLVLAVLYFQLLGDGKLLPSFFELKKPALAFLTLAPTGKYVISTYPLDLLRMYVLPLAGTSGFDSPFYFAKTK